MWKFLHFRFQWRKIVGTTYVRVGKIKMVVTACGLTEHLKQKVTQERYKLKKKKNISFKFTSKFQIEIKLKIFQMMGYVIPSKGDIVLGQEFTDFDKGLEEGIEGSVLGFNFLLSTAFHTEETSPVTDAPLLNIFPTSHGLIDNNHYYGLLNRDDFNSINRRSIYQQNPFVFYKTNIQDEQSGRIVFKEGEIKSNLENERTMFQVPLGLQLVMISHSHCEIGRGSPFIGGQLMLISWTRTPVRVFGGAIVKPVKSVCGYFY